MGTSKIELALSKYLNEGKYNHITFSFPGKFALNRILIFHCCINEYSWLERSQYLHNYRPSKKDPWPISIKNHVLHGWLKLKPYTRKLGIVYWLLFRYACKQHLKQDIKSVFYKIHYSALHLWFYWKLSFAFYKNVLKTLSNIYHGDLHENTY